jgi:hypothetical protein
MNIVDAIRDDRVFAQHFRSPTWEVWLVFLCALFALPMTTEQLAIYKAHTGRNTPPTSPLHEVWLVIGRRGGKSFVLAVIAIFLACFRDWRPFLGPGEVGTVMIIAADRRQARVIMRYCLGLLEAVPILNRKHYGKDDDPIMVWQAATRDMNASVPQSYIDAHLADDPVRAAAEYLAQFRSDLEGFVLREAVEACITVGVRERPPQPFLSYQGFADPSGGSADSFGLCIGHKDHGKQIVVIDALREIKAPFSPENAVYEFARLLKSYNISRIEGDHYAGAWPLEQFRKFGIHYEPSAKPKSQLYVDLLPLINSRRIELLDDARLINQLCALERRTARSGRDSIDHPPGAHDDLVNAVAGVAALNNKYGSYDTSYSWVGCWG